MGAFDSYNNFWNKVDEMGGCAPDRNCPKPNPVSPVENKAPELENISNIDFKNKKNQYSKTKAQAENPHLTNDANVRIKNNSPSM